MAKTKIDWADVVWNPVTGCTKVSEGCKNCYAEKMANRLQKMGEEKYKNGFQVTCHEAELKRSFPGKGKKIFINSMSDLFHKDVPFSFIASVMIFIRNNPQHVFVILTKRPARAIYYSERQKYYSIEYSFPRNLWFGVSVENQETANVRIPTLLNIPAAVRFVSVEPMLEEIDLRNLNASGWWMDSLKGITSNTISDRCPMETKLDWVICGGESGPDARPVHPDWVRSLRNQCVNEQVPFFFKQWGTWTQIYDRDIEDSSWSNLPKKINGKTQWLNLAGGSGFHGERVVMVKKNKGCTYAET